MNGKFHNRTEKSFAKEKFKKKKKIKSQNHIIIFATIRQTTI
jgi:hypothetical protein